MGAWEHELKFSLVEPPPAAADLVALGRGGRIALVETGVGKHLDTYFDDDDGRLRSAGWALRTRRRLGADEPVVATLKRGGRIAGASHRRLEVEAPMRGGDWPPAVARPLAAYVALWQLRPRITLEVERASYRALRDGRPLATVALDRVAARLPGSELSVHFDELEIEALGGAEPGALQEVADLLGGLLRLTPSPVSKLERAAAALELGASS